MNDEQVYIGIDISQDTLDMVAYPSSGGDGVSFSRKTNGVDTNDDSVDFHWVIPTPGSANQ